MRHMRAVPASSDDDPKTVTEQLEEIGNQLEAATKALRNLVEELRADLPHTSAEDTPAEG